MPLAITPIPFKPPRLIGLSETLLARHYEADYGGALRQLNAIESRKLDLGDEALGLVNSVILHEVYFDSLGGADGLGGAAIAPPEYLATALERDFGSLAQWQEEFVALGKSLDGGKGWVVLTWSPRRGRLVNRRAHDDTQAVADGIPILALDMYEHAYRLDFGSDASEYVETFMVNLHWKRPEQRYRNAVDRAVSVGPNVDDEQTESPESLRRRIEAGEEIIVLDTCLAEDMARRTDKIQGALVRQPESVCEWMRYLPRDRPVVAYCVYGFQVSANTVAALREAGFDARRLAGGITAWHAVDGPVEPLG